MKAIVSVLVVVLMASPLMAEFPPVGVWNFNDGSTNDTSGVGVAANGTLSGGAAIVADPLGGRGTVLYIANGGVMTTPAASEPKFDSSTYTKISFWAYTPFAVGTGQGNDWWEMTIGKGYSGPARSFVDSQAGLTVDYFFSYTDIVRRDNSIFNLALYAYPKPKGDGWHFYESAVWENMVDGNPGFAAALWIDGILDVYGDTQSMLEFDLTGARLRLNDDVVQIGGNGWHGYIDDVTYSIWIPEPCTIALLGFGAALIRRKRRI